MRISIIIPVYNVEKYISRCLLSVINQTYNDTIECIIINDCTSDNSMTIINELITTTINKNIIFKTINHTVNQGQSAARNSGIRVSTGEYLFFLDSDDELCINALEDLANLAQQYNPDIVLGNIYINSPKVEWLNIANRNYPTYTDNKEFICDEWIKMPGVVWNKLIKRSFIINHNLYFKEGIIHEDNHWLLFSKKYIHSIAFCFKPTYIYYINENTTMTTKYKDKSILSLLSIADEYFNEYTYENNKNEYKDLIGHLINIKKNLIYQTQNKKSSSLKYRKFILSCFEKKNLPIKLKVLFLYLLFPKSFIKNKITNLFLS